MDIHLSSKLLKTKQPLNLDYFHQATERVLKICKIKHAELSIVFLTGSDMRKLNRVSLGHDYITDVITFDLKEGQTPFSEKGSVSLLDGEIYVCPPEAKRNAREFNQPFKKELLRYIIHGILHLLGFDDKTDKERRVMRAKENEILSSVESLREAL